MPAATAAPTGNRDLPGGVEKPPMTGDDSQRVRSCGGFFGPVIGGGRADRLLTSVRSHRTISSMRIRSTRHRGLKRLIEDDDDRDIRPDLVKRVRRILTALQSAQGIEGLRGPPGRRLHQLSGDRAGTWSISVFGNWRITFNIEDESIRDLNLEDYH